VIEGLHSGLLDGIVYRPVETHELRAALRMRSLDGTHNSQPTTRKQTPIPKRRQGSKRPVDVFDISQLDLHCEL